MSRPRDSQSLYHVSLQPLRRAKDILPAALAPISSSPTVEPRDALHVLGSEAPVVKVRTPVVLVGRVVPARGGGYVVGVADLD